jgi:hypothetical protein
VFIGRSAAAEEAEWFGARVPEFVALSGEHGDGVASGHITDFSFDTDSTDPVSDIVDLLGPRMVVFLGGAADGQTCLCQTLVANSRVVVGQQFANFRAVLGDEGGDFI